MAFKWRAECLDCPYTPDLDWGHTVPTSYTESAVRSQVDAWAEDHRKRTGHEIKVVQTTTLVVNVESLNQEVLDKLFARSN
ncbi:gp102 [Mycobacterium phage Barnyard]|uniref:Uncharacterized protein n=1 Tax=Mycobacterium phage Barnyard TaxID=205880 RepID=Q855X0_9CAUD|nr:gp102 [Mycobacterium phage Barnyard]AAN02156.1 hypothetical protein PBI_BARNYARD_102 [Mycobacterium phage Barnyard]